MDSSSSQYLQGLRCCLFCRRGSSVTQVHPRLPRVLQEVSTLETEQTQLEVRYVCDATRETKTKVKLDKV